MTVFSLEGRAGWLGKPRPKHPAGNGPTWGCADCDVCGDFAGTWYWLRSPEQEQRVIVNLYNRYCVRCHAVDGRGVWDIPDVPNFANPRWQASRSDSQLARAILEGRGAVMPAFRGTLTLEESCAMARYLRTFVPGTEASRPDLAEPAKSGEEIPAPKPVNPAAAPKDLPVMPIGLRPMYAPRPRQ